MSSAMVVLMTLCLALFMISRGDCLTGFQFEDNLSKEHSTPENGNMTFRIPKLDHYGQVGLFVVDFVENERVTTENI